MSGDAAAVGAQKPERCVRIESLLVKADRVVAMVRVGDARHANTTPDIAQAAIAAMPDVVEKIKGGKLQAIGALIGPVMKATRGQADAGRVREIVMEQLGVTE